MFNNLRADIGRYTQQGKASFKDKIYALFEQGLWAIIVYRFGCFAKNCRIPLLNIVLRIVAFLLFKNIEIITGISLPASAKIGKGFYVGHFSSIIVHSDVEMGENCSIGTGVVIGTRGLGSKGVANIGNNVYIGVGAKILGPVTIGDNARIGANAVVLHDVPAGATVVGIPARIIGSR